MLFYILSSKSTVIYKHYILYTLRCFITNIDQNMSIKTATV